MSAPRAVPSVGSVQCLGTTAPGAESLGISTIGGQFTWCRGDLSVVPILPPDLERHEVRERSDASTPIAVEPGPAWTRDAEWAADLEYVWRVRVADAMRSLHARARRRRGDARAILRMEDEYGRSDAYLPAMRVTALRAAEWADHRARSLAMTRADVLATCGKRWRGVKCGCGIREMKVGCDQPQLCGHCRRKHSQKWRKRIVAGMDHSLRTERARWWNTPRHRRRGMLPGIYLLTLTAPHSGDLAGDRDAMGAAVRRLLKHATKHRWWRTYALTWEATNGDDGLGHMHAHLAVVSSWIPYSSEQAEANDPGAWCPRRKGERKRQPRGLHDVWRDAMPGAVVLDVKAPRQSAPGGDSMSAGIYLAKYVTKGIDPAEFTGRKAGELLVAFRGKRKVTTSAGFWEQKDPTCECCKQVFESTGAPMSLQELHPAAVFRSQAERAGWWIPRGSSQVGLRWPAGAVAG